MCGGGQIEFEEHKEKMSGELKATVFSHIGFR